MASCRHFSGRLTHELCADCLRRFCARVFCRFFSGFSPALPRNFYTRQTAPVTAVCAAMAALAQAPWHLPFPRGGTKREGGKVALQDVRAKSIFPMDKISTAASIGTAFRLNPFKPHVHQELTVQQRRVERKTTRVARHQLRQLQHASITEHVASVGSADDAGVAASVAAAKARREGERRSG